MTDYWEERRTALTERTTYRVIREAPSGPDGAHFKVGEEVRLSHVAYSHYDNSHVYTLEGQNGAARAYWLHDDEPIERLIGTFAC